MSNYSFVAGCQPADDNSYRTFSGLLSASGVVRHGELEL